MAEKASRPFWLDGGYDRDCVDACQYAPLHNWWVFCLVDVMSPEWMQGRHDQGEQMVICRGCYVPRCGHTTEPNPCILPRHHEGSNHVYAQDMAA